MMFWLGVPARGLLWLEIRFQRFWTAPPEANLETRSNWVGIYFFWLYSTSGTRWYFWNFWKRPIYLKKPYEVQSSQVRSRSWLSKVKSSHTHNKILTPLFLSENHEYELIFGRSVIFKSLSQRYRLSFLWLWPKSSQFLKVFGFTSCIQGEQV